MKMTFFVIFPICAVYYTLDKINDFTDGQIEKTIYTIKIRRLLRYYEFEKLAKHIVKDGKRWKDKIYMTTRTCRLTETIVQELFLVSKDAIYEKSKEAFVDYLISFRSLREKDEISKEEDPWLSVFNLKMSDSAYKLQLYYRIVVADKYPADFGIFKSLINEYEKAGLFNSMTIPMGSKGYLAFCERYKAAVAAQ